MRRRIHEQQTEIAGLHLIQNAFTQIAHDVRAPLSALNAVVSTLGPEAADEKEVLVSAAQRIRGIAEGLLKMKLYRPLVSHRPSPPQPEALTLGKVEECIEQIIAEKRYQYQQRVELRLESELESVAGQRVALDTVSLGRVLSNLIENSVESVKVTGFVGIRISTVRGFLLIEVRDNGSGIDANILPKLGRAGATFGKEGGTGLGLYHARVYFESLGGAFGIDSEPGKGTTISLAAPLLKGN
jgi:signal transduction histidine kinase